jgi:hypothetical protein
MMTKSHQVRALTELKVVSCKVGRLTDRKTLALKYEDSRRVSDHKLPVQIWGQVFTT